MENKIGVTLSLNSARLIDQLPAMPHIAQKILSMSADNLDYASLASLIEQDAQISAKIISMANSPLMSRGVKIVSIRDAAMVLGFDLVKNTAFALSSMSKIEEGKYFSPKGLFAHSLGMSIVMSEIARYMPARVRPNADLIQLSGLMHDIGYVALCYVNKSAVDEIHRQVVLNPQEAMVHIDGRVTGVTHSEIGYSLAIKWNLPAEIASVIRDHHNMDISSGQRSKYLLTELARLAERLMMDFGFDENTPTADSGFSWSALHIAPEKKGEVVAAVGEMLVQLSQGIF